VLGPKKEEAIPVGTASFILYKIKKEKNLFSIKASL
jgi:hypothetical protein